MTDNPLINLIFQSGLVPVPTFSIKDFKFLLVQSLPDDDLFVYEITKDDFCMLFFVFGVDVSSRCGPLCSVDFVHFVWRHFERTSDKQYVITLIPFDVTTAPPRLLCVKHHRAASDGWKDAANCGMCVTEYRLSTRTQSGCRLPDT
jgi:hypothetical protein